MIDSKRKLYGYFKHHARVSHCANATECVNKWKGTVRNELKYYFQMIFKLEYSSCLHSTLTTN